MKIGKRRQAVIAQDEPIVWRIYEAACAQLGAAEVHRDLTRIWDQRCAWGIKGIVPFGSMHSQNMSEVLWVAESVCGIKRGAK